MSGVAQAFTRLFLPATLKLTLELDMMRMQMPRCQMI